MDLINPSSSETLPSHMTKSRDRYYKHLYATMCLALCLSGLAICYAPLMEYESSALRDMQFGAAASAWLAYNVDVFTFRFDRMYEGYFADFNIMTGDLAPLVKFIAWAGGAFMLGMAPQIMNKNRRIVEKSGWVEWGDETALEAMEARKQVGIRGGRMMALGKWAGKDKKRRGKMVRLAETLSVLCLAPPGTGKTAGFVIPSLLANTDASSIVYDPKPELFAAIGGYKQTVSHVFMLDWGRIDMVDKKDLNKSILYPRFNFLSPKLVPAIGPDRDTFVDSIAKVMIPEPKGGGDSYFIDKGRSAFTGFTHYLLASVGDRGKYDSIPRRWHGMEPSIPMLAEWIAFAQLKFTEKVPGQEVDPGASTDKLGDWIRDLTNDVKPEGPFPSARAYIELSSLVNMADKERSGVLGTMDQAFLPFKNEAVQQRTSSCDFTPDDMRGIIDPAITARTLLDKADPKYLSPRRRRNDAMPGGWEWQSPVYRDLFYDRKNWMPVNLFLCSNQSDAPAFSKVTTLLLEVLSSRLISFGPYEWNDKTNRILGPFDFLFAMDEFAKLGKSQSVMSGPDLGRSKKTSYMIVAQDYGQLENIYSKADISIIDTTTAVKFVLPQNNTETVNKIKAMVGKTTIERTSRSQQEGFSKQANPFSWNASRQLEEVDFLRTEDVSALPPGKVIVLVQGFMNRPLLLDAPMYFKDPEMLKKVRTGDKGPLATMVLPDHIKAARVAELRAKSLSDRKADNEKERADKVAHDPPQLEIEEVVRTC